MNSETNDPYVDGYDDYNAGKQFHETRYARVGDALVSNPEYTKGAEWRRGWNDAALGRAPSRDRLVGIVEEVEPESITLSLEQFLALPEYSCSIPTGQTPGKRWRRREPYEKRKGEPTYWYLGEYYDYAITPETSPVGYRGSISIRWYRISLDDLMHAAQLARGELG